MFYFCIYLVTWKGKWVWLGNATLTGYRQTHDNPGRSITSNGDKIKTTFAWDTYFTMHKNCDHMLLNIDTKEDAFILLLPRHSNSILIVENHRQIKVLHFKRYVISMEMTVRI